MEAKGLPGAFANVKFAVLAYVMRNVLPIFELGNTVAQDEDIHLGKANEFVNACLSVLKEKK